MCSCYHAEELLSSGFAKISVHFSKIVKTNRKTQEICSFNLQTAGVLGKQKAALPGGDKAACRKHLFSLFVPGIRYHPRQIHQTQRHRNGGQKAQNIVFFTQQAGKRTGDDIAVGIVQKVEIGIQWFIQEVNRQGRAKQKSQHGGRWGGSLSPQAEPGRAPAGHGC